MRRQDYNTAIILYRKAIQTDAHQHEFYFGLFRAYWLQGKRERATDSLRQALRIAEEDAATQRYMSKLTVLDKQADNRP